LIEFVEPENRSQEVPCHHIRITAEGETIEDLELEDNDTKLASEVARWLRTKIQEIEKQRANATVTT
jgi:hypothetical protein